MSPCQKIEKLKKEDERELTFKFKLLPLGWSSKLSCVSMFLSSPWSSGDRGEKKEAKLEGEKMSLNLGGGKLWGREEGRKNPGQGKRKIKMPYLDVFGFILKTAWTASSWTGALVAAGSLQPVYIQLQEWWKTVDTGPNKLKKNMEQWPPKLNSNASTGMRREDKLLRWSDCCSMSLIGPLLWLVQVVYY